MARHFAGTTDWITLALGNLGFVFGPGTVAFIGSHASAATAVDMGIFGADPIAGPVWSLFFIHGTDAVDANKLSLYTGGANPTYGPVVVAADGVVCGATSKATGTVVGRTYLYKYGTGVGAHADNTTAAQNAIAPTVSARIGDDANGVDPYSGDILMIGVWDVVLTDAQKESLPFSLAAWFQVQPRGLWLLDQSATTQKVLDISGGRADESALSGTTIAAASFPVFNLVPGWVQPATPGPTGPIAVDLVGTVVGAGAEAGGLSAGVTYMGAGVAATAASGDVTADYPLGASAPLLNDIILCDVTARDNVVVTFPAGWTKKAEANIGTGLRQTIAWRRRAGGDSETDVTVTHTGGAQIIARVHVVRGAVTTGDPFGADAGPTSVPAATTGTFPDVTTIAPGSLLFYALGYSDDFATAPAITNAQALTLTERDSTEVP